MNATDANGNEKLPAENTSEPCSGGAESGAARGEALRGLLKASNRLSNMKTRAQWRKIVARLVDSRGALFNPGAPNRRVEGAFGRDESGGALSKVAVVADVSAGMTAPMLYSCLTELSIFSTTAGINMARFGYFCFFYRPENDGSAAGRYGAGAKKTFPFIEDAFVRGSALAGATDLSTALELAKASPGTRADALILFTSGRIGAALGDAANKFLHSMRKKTVWVLPDGVRDVDGEFERAAAEAVARRWVVSAGGGALPGRE